MDSLLTTAQLTEYLGVTRTSLYLWIREKNFPRKKLGHLNRYVLNEVKAWIAEQTQKADADISAAKNMYPRLGRRDPHKLITFTLD